MAAFGQNVISMETMRPLETAQSLQQPSEPFQTLESLISAIQKVQIPDEDIDKKLDELSENTLFRMFTRTKDLLLAAVEYKPKINDQSTIDSVNSQEILHYGYTISNECFKSAHKNAETLGRYFAGYDTYLISFVQGMSHANLEKQVHESMSDPTILAEILSGSHRVSAKNVGRAALKLVVPGSPFDDISFYDMQADAHFIPPQHDDI